MKKTLTPQSSAQFLIYKSDNQDVKVDVLLHNENIWLTQEQMAQLFGKAKNKGDRQLYPNQTLS